MLNVVLSAIPTHFISSFTLSRVEREVDSLRRKFLWGDSQKEGKAFCLVSWKRVCKHKKFGGLGIINPWDFNDALLLKCGGNCLRTDL